MQKIKKAPSDNELIAKVNEIIDSNNAGSSAVVLTEGDNININYTVDWAQANTNGTSVAFGNGYFISVGGQGQIWQSLDGVNWDTPVIVDSNEYYWQSVAYGNGIFAAVGWHYGNQNYHHYIAISQDGINWDIRQDYSGSTDIRYTKVIYGNGVFVVISPNKTVISSTDALEWTIYNNSYGLSDIIYKDNVYIACASSKVYKSSDALTWTQSTTVGDGTAEIVVWSVTADETQYIAFWQDYTNSKYGIITSTDLTNWSEMQEITLSGGGSSWYARNIYYAHGTYIIGGYLCFMSSYDLTTWTSVSDAVRVTSMAFGNGRYVVLSGYMGIVNTVISATIPSEYVTDTELSTELADYTPTSGLATVATSGDYDDLMNKPTIPAAVTVDSALSATSENPVQNKVINSALSNKYDASNPNGYTSNIGTVTSVNNVNPVNGNVSLTIPAQTDVKINNTSITSGGVANIVTNTAYNASSNKIATMSDLPTDTNDLTNGAGYITNSALSGYATTSDISDMATETWVGQQGYITGISGQDVTTALGYTPYNSSNPSGYQANVIETVKVNGTAQTVTSKAVDITVPTNNNQLTNGAGYITNSAISNMQTTTNLVTSVSGSSTDSQYPSAKLFYDTCGDIETLINAL